MSSTRGKLSRLLKLITIVSILSVSISYLVITNYLDINSVQETVAVTIAISFLTGLMIRDIKILLITVFLSMVFTLVISASIVTFFIFLPFISVEETSYLFIAYLTAVSLIRKTFITMFFFIFPFNLIFNIIGFFLAENLT